MKKWYAAIALLVATFGIPSFVFAQGNGSSLSGLITDNSQAVVPGAAVKVRHLSTNVTSQTFTDNAETAHETRQDFALAVAGATQTVTVSADVASYLSPDDAMIATSIDNTTAESAPL